MLTHDEKKAWRLELARRVGASMEAAKVSSSLMAETCNVTIQALTGWLSEGRIHKRHLPKIALLTGQPLAYFLEPDERPGMGHDDDLIALLKAWPLLMPPERTEFRKQVEVKAEYNQQVGKHVNTARRTPEIAVATDQTDK